MNVQNALGPTGHIDSFSRDNLPPADQWPEINHEIYDYPPILNAGVEFTDRMVEKGFGDHTALIGNGRRRTYKELTDWIRKQDAYVEEQEAYINQQLYSYQGL